MNTNTIYTIGIIVLAVLVVYMFIRYVFYDKEYFTHNAETETSHNTQGTNITNINEEFMSYMSKYNIPSGQICIIQDNKVIYQNSYGNINCDDWNYPPIDRPNRKVNNNDVFRIASSTKPMTAMTILSLVDKKMITLDEPAFAILARAKMIEPSTITDPRLHKITVRDLLRHAGGWDSGVGLPGIGPFDPQYDALRIASHDVLKPANSLELIQFMIKQPLNFDPGSKFVYSNFGYNVLGRIIEAVTKTKYEDYVKQNIFSKVFIDSYIGSSNMANRGPNEVMYCDKKSDDTGYPIDPNLPYKVPISYGNSFVLNVMDSHGGWVMNALDLAKFGNGVLNYTFVSKDTFDQIYVKPSYAKGNKFYSLGLNLDYTENALVFNHAGALTDGTLSFIAIVPKYNYVVGVIFNRLDLEKMPALANDLQKIVLSCCYK